MRRKVGFFSKKLQVNKNLINMKNIIWGGALKGKESFYNKKGIVLAVAAIVLVSGFFAPSLALAAATVTPASGGTNISIDTTSAPLGSGTYKTLSGPGINELVAGDISTGIHTITLPAGWEFEISAISITTFGSDIAFQSTSITPSPTSFSFNVTAQSTTGGFVGFGGLKVRPTGTTPSTSNITHSEASIVGVTDGSTNFGTLTTIPGTVTKLAFTTPPGATTVYGSNLSTQPVVKTQDQFGNESSNGASGKTVTLTLVPDTGNIVGTASLDISSGTASFSGLTVDSVGTKQLTAMVEGLTSANSGSFEITQKELTVSGLSATSRPYDGTTVAEVTGTPAPVGVVDGDDVSLAGTAVGPFDSANAGSRTVAVTGLSLAGADSANYTLTQPTLDSSITAKVITITPDSGQTKVYGEVDQALMYTNTALIGGDSITGALSRISGTDVDAYSYTLGSLSAGGNYSLSLGGTESFTITARPLTVTATGITKPYDANTDATVTLSSDKISGDDVTPAYTSASFSDKTATDGKTVSVSGISISGAKEGNYNLLNETAVTTANITKKSITATLNVKNKIYDGTTSSSFQALPTPHIVLSDVIPGDDVTVLSEGTKSFLDKHVANDKTVNGSGITLTGVDKDNYIFNGTGTGIANITVRAIAVTAVTDSKTYDGTTGSLVEPAITTDLESDPIAPGDTDDFFQTYDTEDFGINKTLTPDGVVHDGNPIEGNNYTVTLALVSTGVITKAPLTATITVSNKVVDGNTSATILTRILVGKIDGDDVTPNADGVATFASANVGNGQTVTASGITLAGDDKDNYSFDDTATGTGNILPVPTTVYVNGSWAGTGAWTDPDGAGPATYFGYDAFATIQEGINAVAAAGTVNVAAGTYVENVSLDSKPNITIQGVGDTTVVEPGTGIGFAITDSNGVTIKNLKIHTTGADAHGIWVAGTPNEGSAVNGLTVQDTTIVVDGYSTGIYAEQVNPAHTGWLIGGFGHGNTITINQGTGVTGDGLDLHDVSGSTVSYNTITLNTPTNSTNVLWTSELSDLTNLVFNNNTVSGSSGSEIAFVPNFVIPTNSSTITTVTVSGNTFSNWGSRGLRIGSGVASVIVSENKFLGTGETLKNEDVSEVNAENNWWGTAVASTIDGKTNGTIDFEPYYVESGMSVLSSDAVDTVYVDGTYIDGSAGIHIFGYDAFATIQEAIDAVAAAGTVSIAAGTYDVTSTPGITVDKSVTISGAGADTTTVTGRNKNGSVVNGSDILFNVTANNVTIEKLTIDLGDSDSDYDVGVFTANSSGINNLTVRNSALLFAAFGNSIGEQLIHLGGGSGSTVSDNILETASGNSGLYVGDGANTSLTVNGNTVAPQSVVSAPNAAGANDADGGGTLFNQMGPVTNSTISGNNFTNTGIAIYLGAGSSNTDTVTVSNNIFTSNNGHSAGYGALAITSEVNGVDTKNITVTGNTFTGSQVAAAITIFDSTNTTVPNVIGSTLTINGNKFNSDNFGGINVGDGVSGTVNAEANWWGTTNGATIAEAISGLVDYRPWCTSDTCTPVDPTSPTIAVNELLTNDTTPTITGTVNESSVVKINVNGTDYTASVIGTSWSADVTNTLTAGTYSVTATAEDLAGNIGTDTTSDELTIDTIAPTVALTKNHTDLIVRDADTVIITATFNEVMTAPTISIGDIVSGAIMTNTSGNIWTYSWDVPAGNDGVVAATVVGADLAGNPYAGADSILFTIDNTAPAVAITQPAADSSVNSVKVIIFTDNGTAPQCSIDNSIWVNCVSGTTTLGDVAGFNALADGNFNLYLRDIDVAGNSGTAQVALVKDTTAPSIMGKTPSANAVGVAPSSDITVTFNEDVVFTGANVTITNNPAKTVTFVSGTKIATIDPTDNLANNTKYTITLTGVTDTIGNALPDTSWYFTTSASYSISLTTGWNLISLPVVPTDTNASAVLGTVLNDSAKIETIWKYDPEAGTWGAYHPGVGMLSDFSDMTAGEGYWINYLSSTAGTIAGTGNLFQEGNSAPPQKTLAAGWNLIGYYQLENVINTTATKALSSVSGQWTQLRTYDNSLKQFQSVTESNYMKPGEGYWIFMKSSSYAPYLYGPGDTD
ncbi:hypothetical protein A3K28_00910 [Candidatus Azambacteria bacterium RIFOXYB1_FULL_40_33]|nr:MAG: hypothetical protein A3K28_00910 [Candidatus Azambacteria bacterium RIFOXYB1_FULL_40_33]OGD42477.1 MAG: hypothetical protein A2193_00920 [Candidatus Azambacteria bacterium RIFOXYA1_FULL_42_37]HCQ63299.1 hypothetical protein [Candidatus Azambacteria bacterium]